MDDVYRLHPKAIWSQMKREPLCFWLFCGYLFFEYVRPQTIYPTIAILPWASMLLLASFIAVLLDSRQSKSVSGPLTLPVLGFFLVLFLTFPFAFNPAASIARADVLVNWVLLYLLFMWTVNSKFRLLIVFLILLLASFKMAQFGFRIAVGRGFAFQRWGVGGPSGWFQNAADLGVQMTIYISWALAFYFGLKKHWKGRWLRWLVLFFSVAGFVTALATNQRNTVLALVVMAIVLVIASKNRVRNLLMILLVASFAYVATPAEFKDRFVNMEESDTAVTRLDFWERGLGFYASHPLLGVGYNNYTSYYAAMYPGDVNHRGSVMVAHSVPVTIAAETGTLGIIFFVMVILAVFMTNIRAARIFCDVDPPFWRLLALSLNYGLIGFLVTGIFLSTTYYPFLWVQAGLSASLYGIAQRERQKQVSRAKRPLRAGQNLQEVLGQASTRM